MSLARGYLHNTVHQLYMRDDGDLHIEGYGSLKESVAKLLLEYSQVLREGREKDPILIVKTVNTVGLIQNYLDSQIGKYIPEYLYTYVVESVKEEKEHMRNIKHKLEILL
jgi:hypothetical protein